MIRKIAAIVIGAFVAIALIAAVQYTGHQVYPPPSGIDVTDEAAMKAYAAALPVGALLFVGVAWMIGVLGGGILAAIIAREAPAINCLIVGGLVLAGTIMTLISIPHPLWFSITSVIAVVTSIFLTCRIAAVFAAGTSTERNSV